LTTMLRVELGRLSREGSVLVEASIPAEDSLWDECGIEWDGAVDVRVQAAFAGSGEVVARGSARGWLRQECRRCLKAVRTPFEGELTLVFVEAGTVLEEGDGFAFDPMGGELDMSSALREELVLAVNPYVVCDPGCLGLCPQCGIDLNEGSCECREEGVDPRWEALRKLKGR